MNKILLVCAIMVISITTFAQTETIGETKIIHLNDADFKKKIFDYENNKDWKFKGDKPSLIDFYATWCGPCKRVAPVLEELQKEYGNTIQIYKIDVDRSKEVSAVFGINSMPTFLFIPTNGLPQMAKGALPKETFIEAIRDILKVEHPTNQ